MPVWPSHSISTRTSCPICSSKQQQRWMRFWARSAASRGAVGGAGVILRALGGCHRGEEGGCEASNEAGRGHKVAGSRQRDLTPRPAVTIAGEATGRNREQRDDAAGALAASRCTASGAGGARRRPDGAQSATTAVEAITP